MNPTLALIQTILGLVPVALNAATAIRGTLSTDDQTELDAMIATHRAQALSAVAAADVALDAAAKV